MIQIGKEHILISKKELNELVDILNENYKRIKNSRNWLDYGDFTEGTKAIQDALCNKEVSIQFSEHPYPIAK